VVSDRPRRRVQTGSLQLCMFVQTVTCGVAVTTRTVWDGDQEIAEVPPSASDADTGHTQLGMMGTLDLLGHDTDSKLRKLIGRLTGSTAIQEGNAIAVENLYHAATTPTEPDRCGHQVK
jgi:hypothetical protein